MKRIYLLACGAVLSGCLHSAPASAPAPVQVPAPVVQQEKPELTVALVEQSVVKGKTSRVELLAKLGNPNSVVNHPYHVPKITAPGFKMEVPPEMMAVETWNYWKISADGSKGLLVKFHIDETGVVLDYEVKDKLLK
jgi:hypothetical protein